MKSAYHRISPGLLAQSQLRLSLSGDCCRSREQPRQPSPSPELLKTSRERAGGYRQPCCSASELFCLSSSPKHQLYIRGTTRRCFWGGEKKSRRHG